MTHIAQSSGYITAYNTNDCNFYETRGWNSPYIDMTMADHVQMGIACNPTVFPYSPDDPMADYVGPESMTRKCYLGTDVAKHVFDYALDFHKKYSNKAKYSWNAIIDGHEWSTFVPGFIDEHFLTFVKQLEAFNILEDTLVIFWSDHGQHGVKTHPQHEMQQGRIEHYNWFMHALFPRKHLTEDIQKNLKENSQRLLSHGDIHKTITQHMLGIEGQATTADMNNRYNYNYAYNLLHEIIPDDRTCETIATEECICE